MILIVSFHFQMSNDAQVYEIIYKNEEVADKILANKQELVNWDKKRQGNREALRELQKSDEKKVWITVGSMLIQMERIKAIDVLIKGIDRRLEESRGFKAFPTFLEQAEIEKEVNKLRDEQLVLVKKHKDLEKATMPKGFDLKPMSRSEMSCLKNELKL